LDGWRGLAILLVLGEHFAGTPTGRLGVEVFFVLSGMLMAKVLFHDRVPIRTFYQRRIARVFPTFYLYVATVAIVGWLAHADFSRTHLLYTATFTRSYLPPGTSIWSDLLPLGHIWSLNVEEHAYVVLSLVAILTATALRKSVVWWLGALALACLVMGWWYSRQPQPAGTPTALHTEVAAFGLMASAALAHGLRGRRVHPWLAGAVLALTLACVLLTHRFNQGQLAYRLLVYVAVPLMLALSVNVLHAAPAWVLRVLSAPWLTWFGVCSFSLYLWQQPFYRLQASIQLEPVLALAMATAVGAASFYGFEQPVRLWIRGWGRRAPPLEPVPATLGSPTAP
jgi:peptidoglycan/LPS O-acetylase OafA/YrhL